MRSVTPLGLLLCSCDIYSPVTIMCGGGDGANNELWMYYVTSVNKMCIQENASIIWTYTRYMLTDSEFD